MFRFREHWAHAHDVQQETFMALAAMYVEANPTYRAVPWLRPAAAARKGFAPRPRRTAWWERDRPAFERLQQRLARRGTAAAQAAREWPAHFVAIDLLHLGDDLTGWPYARRRATATQFRSGPAPGRPGRPRPPRRSGRRNAGPVLAHR